MSNQEIIFAERPAGAPTAQTFALRGCAMPAAGPGELVVEAALAIGRNVI
jgi:hypothetical protein